MDLKEIQRHAFEAADMYPSFEKYQEAEGEEKGTEYKITLLAPMKDEVDKYIKSIDQLMQSFANGDNTPYTSDEMHP